MGLDVLRARMAYCHALGLHPEHTAFIPVARELVTGEWRPVSAVQLAWAEDGAVTMTLRTNPTHHMTVAVDDK